MEKHPIQGLMDTTMEHIRDMVDVNTVLGDPIIAQDGSTVVPVSKVSFGFVAGGGEYSSQNSKPEKQEYPFAGGAGAGVTIQPVGFLVCGDNHVRMLPAQTKCAADRVIDLIPAVMEELKTALSKMNGKSGKKRCVESTTGADDPQYDVEDIADKPLQEVPAE